MKTNKQDNTEKIYERTEYEKAHGLRSRIELKDILIKKNGLLDELDDEEFHMIYAMVWKLTAKDTIIHAVETQRKMAQDELKQLQENTPAGSVYDPKAEALAFEAVKNQGARK